MTIKANTIGIRTPINSFGNRPIPLFFLTTGTLLSDLFGYMLELTGIETPFLLLPFLALHPKNRTGWDTCRSKT
jgi:hypothetical protein